MSFGPTIDALAAGTGTASAEIPVWQAGYTYKITIPADKLTLLTGGYYTSDPAPQSVPFLYFLTPDSGTTWFARVMFPNGKYTELPQPS